MAIAICNMMIKLVRAQVALESGSFEVPSPSGPGRSETVDTSYLPQSDGPLSHDRLCSGRIGTGAELICT
jgi:hypothetical protein